MVFLKNEILFSITIHVSSGDKFTLSDRHYRKIACVQINLIRRTVRSQNLDIAVSVGIDNTTQSLSTRGDCASGLTFCEIWLDDSSLDFWLARGEFVAIAIVRFFYDLKREIS